MKVSAVRSVPDAFVSYSSLGGWIASGRGQGFVDLLRDAGRTRAFGDFWSYMLVAEGAVEAVLAGLGAAVVAAIAFVAWMWVFDSSALALFTPGRRLLGDDAAAEDAEAERVSRRMT